MKKITLFFEQNQCNGISQIFRESAILTAEPHSALPSQNQQQFLHSNIPYDSSGVLTNTLMSLQSGCGQCRHLTDTPPSLCLKRALLVTKVSRYEVERQRYSHLNESELEATLRSQCYDYDFILHRHNLHKKFEQDLIEALTECGIEIKIVTRDEYTQNNIEWADIIIPAGGDGTFLMAASRVMGNRKPVVGFNSDPFRSEGHLCLPAKYSTDIKQAIQKLQKGEFEWLFRSRIRVTLIGPDDADLCLELHENQIYPHYSFSSASTTSELQKTEDTENSARNTKSAVLPVLALNEVYIGECMACRVSYFGVSLDDGPWTNVKSSGLCICTGTGSTSWNLSINRISERSVEEIAHLLGLQQVDQQLIKNVTEKFNKNLLFDPGSDSMCYSIRDLISASVWPNPKGIESRGYVKKIEIKSRCFDAAIVVDGAVSYKFNEGMWALLEIKESDALRTVKLIENSACK